MYHVTAAAKVYSGGSRAARELGAVRTIESLVAEWAGDAELGRQMKLIGALIESGSEGLNAVLKHLGLSLPGVKEPVSDHRYDDVTKVALHGGTAIVEQTMARLLADAEQEACRSAERGGDIPVPAGQRIEWGDGESAGVAVYWY